ncbi:MAG: hypothetical protein UIJ87_08190 [Anaerovoracaceae bacterium]|nr:hypothetical protein [Anaerovoracaceae bacterium]
MTFKRSGIRRDKKKLFSAVMCIFFSLIFFGSIAINGFTISKVVFGGLLLYFGIANLRYSRL